MTWLDVLVLPFAALAVLRAWTEGEICADLRQLMEHKAERYRQALESQGDPTQAPSSETTIHMPVSSWLTPGWLLDWVDMRVPDWVALPFTCPFCLSYHIPWVLILLFLVPAWLSPDWLGVLIRIPLWSLAATGALHHLYRHDD